MRTSNFDDLLYRYLTGKVSPDERIKMEAWLDVVRTRHDADLKLTKADEERLFNKITNQMSRVDEIVSFVPEPYREVRFYQTQWFRVAASIAVIVAFAFVLWQYSARWNGNSVSQYTAGKAFLDDGSIVWLDEGSRLSYSQDSETGNREATLTGAGFFEVAKNESRPFIITCGDIRVRVIGTSFRLKNKSEHIELNVISGKVNVSSEADPGGHIVVAREKLVYRVSGEIERKPMEATEIAALTSGEEYDLVFDNAEMNEVFLKLEKKFNVRFRIENLLVKKCHIKADLGDKTLDETLLLLSEMLHVSYDQDGEVITISGSGC